MYKTTAGCLFVVWSITQNTNKMNTVEYCTCLWKHNKDWGKKNFFDIHVLSMKGRNQQRLHLLLFRYVYNYVCFMNCILGIFFFSVKRQADKEDLDPSSQ